MYNVFSKSFVLVCACLLAVSAFAEKGPLGFGVAPLSQAMETDRPDFTEGTQTIQGGHLQLEAGYTFTYNDEDNFETKSHIFPEFLLRVGLATDLELRLGWEGYASEETETTLDGSLEEDIDGATDMSVGFKHRMYTQDGLAPNFGYIFELGLPVGSTEFGSDKVEPAIKFLWAYDLGIKVGLAGNLNFAAPVIEDERFFETSASATIGYALTEKVGSYFEYYGLYPESSAPENDTHFLNGGFTWGLTPNFQLDIRAGFGLNDESDDFITGAGFAWRM